MPGGRSFRFVHSGDFHLEQPLYGLAEVPGHLRSALIEAPYRAASRVFDTVLSEEADFLVLSGDVLNPADAGTRGSLFLAEQFELLLEDGIQIYWAGGDVDPPDAWPAEVPLPANVHVFSADDVGELTHHRDGRALARLLGVSQRGETAIDSSAFHAGANGLFTLGVAHGQADPEALRRRLDYWALGGRHNASTLFSDAGTACYAGSPQGRCPDETGRHSCAVVDVDEHGKVEVRHTPTDGIRWRRERIKLDDAANAEDLKQQLTQRASSLRQSHPDLHVLVNWTVTGTGEVLRRLRHEGLDTDLLEDLRKKFGQHTPAVWSASLHAQTPESVDDAWYEQDSFLGEFLRAARELQRHEDQAIALDAYLGDLEPGVTSAVSVSDAEARRRLLRRVAQLGVDLMGPQESEPSAT